MQKGQLALKLIRIYVATLHDKYAHVSSSRCSSESGHLLYLQTKLPKQLCTIKINKYIQATKKAVKVVMSKF